MQVHYTHTINDPRVDAAFLDEIDCGKGYFGVAYNYLIRTNGVIEVARDPRTISSIGPRHLHPTHIAIGVVGGLELDGSIRANDTPEQEHALEELLQALADTLQVPLEVEDRRERLKAKQHDPAEQEEEEGENDHEHTEDKEAPEKDVQAVW